ALLDDEHVPADLLQALARGAPAHDANGVRQRAVLDDVHLRACGNHVEQLDRVRVAHPDAAVRPRGAQACVVARSVDLDLAPQRVAVAAAVEAALAPREPQDASEHPVAPRMLGGEPRRPDLAGRTPADEYGVGRTTRTDLGAHDVQPARRALTAVAFAGAVACRRNGIGRLRRRLGELQSLALEAHDDPHPDQGPTRRPAKKPDSNAPHSPASPPP